MNINVFFSFLFFRFPSNWKRWERVYKIGYKEKQSQGYLSYFFFLMEFLWRTFPLLRANRLYAIFNTGLKNLGPSCLRYFFVFFTRSTGFCVIFSYTYIYWIHTDAMITDAVINDAWRKDARRLLYNYIYLSLYCKGLKGLFKVCMWEGAGDRT